METYIAVLLTILVIGKVIGFFLRTDDISSIISRQDQICAHFKNISNEIEALLYKISSKV